MDFIKKLQGKNNTKAYQLLLQLEIESSKSNVLYKYFDDFIELLKSESSFVRVRGFRLACAQAQWDDEHKIEKNIDQLLCMLDDAKPSAVRQCLSALHIVALYQSSVTNKIEEKLNQMNVSKYKESMIPLLEKDMEELREAL